MKRGKLDCRISERISIALQARQECGLCPESHVAAVRSLGIEDAEIEPARRGTTADPSAAAIVAFGLQMYVEPTSITDAQIEAPRQHGYRDREIADVAALDVLTGEFNLAAGPCPETNDQVS